MNSFGKYAPEPICTTTTADWPIEESYWEVMTHGKGHVDLNIRDDEDGLHLIVYQASDDGLETNCNDPKTWRVFDLVERVEKLLLEAN